MIDELDPYYGMILTDLGEFVLGNITLLLEILAESWNQDPHDYIEPPGDEEGDPPGSERGRAGHPDDLDTTGMSSWVAPPPKLPHPAAVPVRQPNDLAVEHGAHPILARHKCCQRESDHEPGGKVAPGVHHERHAEHRRCGQHDEAGAAVAWAKEIKDGAHHEPGEDGPGDGGNAGIPDVLLGEVEIISDDRDERSCREGRDEAGEEGEPREVEGPHVGVREGQELEHLGLVLRVDGEGELGSLIVGTAGKATEKAKGLLSAGESMHGATWLAFNSRHRSIRCLLKPNSA